MATDFLEEWKQENYKIFQRMYPELTHDEIMEVCRCKKIR